MKMFKKFVLSTFIAVISSYAYADVIELDAFNPDHCRQQILQSASTDGLPVLAAYTSDFSDGNTKEFMKNFELLAKQHPDKAFFKWDASKDKLHLTQTLCLQQLGLFVQPNIILLGVFKDDISGETFMNSPLRMSWAGEMTVAEMNKFIDVSDAAIKKSILAQKNHH